MRRFSKRGDGGRECVFDGAVDSVEDGGGRVEGRVSGVLGVRGVQGLARRYFAQRGQYDEAGVDAVQFIPACLKNVSVLGEMLLVLMTVS